MITPNIAFYGYFLRNNTKVKRHGEMTERKTPRFDLCRLNGFWTGLDHLKTKKGEVYLNLIPSYKNPNRSKDGAVTEYYLQARPQECKGSFNLTGLRLMQDTEEKQWICSGEPSSEVKLRNGDFNPLFDERNDGFVIVLGKDLEWLELWVVTDQRMMIDGYRKAFQLGTYDAALQTIRNTAKDVGI